MNWKIVPAKRKGPNTLTSSELVGMSILLINHCDEPNDDMNVYWRAWTKIQSAVAQAMRDN